jgi:hypothetical protein
MKTLHPDAAAALNAIADGISLDSPPKNPPGSGPGWGEQYISSNITQKDIIGALRSEVTSGLGEREGIFSSFGEKTASITGESLAKLHTLVKRALGISSVSNMLSQQYVDKLAIDWCFEDPATRPAFPDFLMNRANEDVSHHRLWLPTAYLQVEEDFQFGPVKIITIPKAFFDEIEERLLTEKPELAENTRAAVQRWRKRFQGNAAVAVSVEGEPIFANQKAKTIAEDVIALLRFFHFASFSSRYFCPTALFGAEYVPEQTSFTIEGDGRFSGQRSSLLHKNAQPWQLSRHELGLMRRSLFPRVETLVDSDGLSEFALRIRSSILTYSRGMTFPEMSDRLVYSLSALESLLLRNASEIIQQNLSERIAFLTVQGIDDRLKVVASCKKVYGARSQYIHHRQRSIVPEDDLELFFVMARRTLEAALRNIRKFTTTDAFIDQIDRIKFA